MLTNWLASAAPDAAVEIAPHAVSVAVLGARGSQPVVTAYGTAPLPAGAVVPALSGHNITDAPAVAAALREACDRAGHRPRRAALVIPDLAARVSLVRFDQIPPRREDLDQLIRWQVKKSSPFPMEDACVTHSPGARSGAGGEFVVVSARQAMVREYEAVCDAAGIYAGLVDLATLSVVNLYLAGGSPPAGDWLIVHMRPEFTSIAILRGEDLIFFRNRPEDDEETLADVVHQTAMYYQDRLAGQGFARVIAGGASRAPGGVEAAQRDLEQRVGRAVEPLDPAPLAALGDRVTLAAPERALLAPLVGILLRTRREAAAA
jgi:Tfp pilus assembly PilM family ATPase